jgi:hypothetical protein
MVPKQLAPQNPPPAAPAAQPTVAPVPKPRGVEIATQTSEADFEECPVEESTEEQQAPEVEDDPEDPIGEGPTATSVLSDEEEEELKEGTIAGMLKAYLQNRITGRDRDVDLQTNLCHMATAYLRSKGIDNDVHQAQIMSEVLPEVMQETPVESRTILAAASWIWRLSHARARRYAKGELWVTDGPVVLLTILAALLTGAAVGAVVDKAILTYVSPPTTIWEDIYEAGYDWAFTWTVRPLITSAAEWHDAFAYLGLWNPKTMRDRFQYWASSQTYAEVRASKEAGVHMVSCVIALIAATMAGLATYRKVGQVSLAKRG